VEGGWVDGVGGWWCGEIEMYVHIHA
jgi:hypothetical protein